MSTTTEARESGGESPGGPGAAGREAPPEEVTSDGVPRWALVLGVIVV